MKKSIKLVALATLLVVSALSVAQGGGGGGRGQGGRMMMMGGPGGNRTFLLMRKDVRADLGLSEDQTKRLEAVQTKAQEDMRAMMENARASGGGFEGNREAMQKMQEGVQKEVDAILTPEQTARLKQISVQMRGNTAIMDPEIQKELGITSEQKVKIEELQTKQREAMMALREKAQNGELDRDQMREISEKNRKIMDEELGKILTPEQAGKLKELGGREFKADPNEQGRIRIGGGRGG